MGPSLQRLLSTPRVVAALALLLLVWGALRISLVRPQPAEAVCEENRDIAAMYIDMWTAKYNSGAFLSDYKQMRVRNDTDGELHYNIAFSQGRKNQRAFKPFPLVK